MLIIPMWLRLSFHEKYKQNRYKNFYYSPLTKWWWHFNGDYLRFPFRMDFSLDNRTRMQEALKMLRKQFDPGDKWADRVDSEYVFVKNRGFVFRTERDWPDLRRNTMPWKELPYIHEYRVDLVDRELFGAFGSDKRGYIFTSPDLFYNPSKRSKKPILEVEGIFKQNNDTRLFWRKVICIRGKDAHKCIYKRYQWAFWDFSTTNKVFGTYPAEWEFCADITEYIPSEDATVVDRCRKRNKLFLYDLADF